MGVPKFFRYISERYPCLSETLREYQIPEFDNLYLDMNGIIHGCSHPNDGDVQFRITEEEIFKNVFHYIEILFRMIQPQKLFFMAVDGVAPRAKINQQRGRRFRSAKEAEVLEAKARAKGVDIPTEKRFDSNCITPGTLFMAKLTKQLKYFISYKISTDRLWQKCTVIFSGSEVPGEGEHKIMDYIRYMKAQPDYNPNTRHCLYGLDADLIMLGLCTHELHFSLLREVVKFGKKQTKIVTPEETKFCLLHLSLLREYIEHEFSPVKNKISFPFDIEKIIDDWVLMGFLIGNDFIPNLPNLHIANGALPVLYHAYMEALPTLDGYINESGFLNLERFEKFLEKLSYVDLEQFNEHYADLKYFESKTGRRPNEFERQIYKKIESIDVVSSSPKKILNKDLETLIYSTMEMSHLHSDDDDILDDESDSDMYSMEFAQHKLDYYMNKLEYENVDSDVLRSQAEGYVRAIQWNLHYYYHGCCSWSWYYPHHYAPYISDIKDFKDLKLEFDLGDPFLPFQQLLAVLPSYSKSLLPAAFQKLLTEEQSPIIDYYPLEFKTDLNGKRQEWEAVVLIPFIDEKNLIDAMEPHCSELTLEEQMRNKHGPMCLYEYTQENLGTYHAPEYFPSISNYAKLILINREDIFVPQDKLVKGLCPGVQKDVYFPGFPTLQYVKHTASLEAAKVKVFDQPSRGENMILHIVAEATDITCVASELLGKSVYVDWPHLLEARVVAVSNSKLKITLNNPQEGYSKENLIEQELPGTIASQWILQKRNIIVTYKSRLGIDIGDTDILVSACPLIGMKYSYGSQGRLALDKEWTETPISYAYQTLVKDISVYSIHPMLYKTVDEIFSMKSVCFMLGHPHYGTMGQVIAPGANAQSGRIKVSMEVVSEPSLDMIRRAQMELNTQYMSGSIAAQRLGINSHLLSRITGTIYVAEGFESQQDLMKHNVGLNLKFNKRNEEVPGYTKKENGQWLYSVKAVDLIRRYMAKCPNLFERLAHNVTNNVFQEDELFTKGSGELADILSWLKEQQFHEVESRSCGTEVLDVDIVQQIEKGVSKFLKSQSYTKKFVLMQVKPHLLFKPGLHLRNSPPDPKSQNRLLDRVCCVRESFTVPLGNKGTIIGIQKAEKITETMFDVLFDEPFPGGLALNGCSDCRGYRLSLTDFINISYGERIEYGRGGVMEMGSDTAESWKRPTNYKSQQSHVNTSAFASFNKENDHVQPGISRLSPQLRFIKKNADETAQRVPCTLMHNPMNQKQQQYPHRNIHSDQNLMVTQKSEVFQSPQKSTQMVGTSEFQALWNELHQSQVNKSSTTVHKLLPSPACASINPTVAANKKAPQDPSAFLKAMLKISDESTNSNVPGKSTVSMPNNQSDAPPLVQQLFDHARQSVNIKKEEKSPIWYCSQLLSHYQLTGVGMPRYSYFTDPQTKCVRAQILLPDTRIFSGKPCTTAPEAAESAAKRVYKELNLDKHQKPDAKLLLPPPQQWYNSRVNTCWTRNVRPPVIPMCPMKVPQVPQPSQSSMMFYPKWGQKSSQNPTVPNVTIHNSQNSVEQRQPQSDGKPKITATTPFVPLQAQKKSRNSNVNQVVRATRDTIKNLAPPVQQQTAVTSPKILKQENLDIDPDKQSLANVPDTVQHSVKSAKPTRPRRSRLAAKFGSPPTVNGNESQ